MAHSVKTYSESEPSVDLATFLPCLDSFAVSGSAGLRQHWCEAKTERLQDKIKRLCEQMRQFDESKELKHEPDGQRSTTDPDSRSMNSQARARAWWATACRRRSIPSTT